MSWNNAEADSGGQWGGAAGGSGDQWGGTTGGDADGSGFNGDDNFGGQGGAPSEERPRGACYNCGEEGHNKADCPKPRVMRCSHCNEEGHLVRNCPDPNAPVQEFTGECHTCGQQGHRSADCPDRPPQKCRNCEEEGHHASECKNPRKIDRSQIADVPGEIAWGKVVAGVEDQDMDLVKEGIQEYIKTHPETTYLELQNAFDQQGMKLFLIAIEKPQMVGAFTNMDLQGNLGKKYTVTYRFSAKPARAREAQYFPETPEENMERLKDAGEPVNSGQMKCHNCEEYGHTSRNCPSEAIEKERVIIKCFNCGEDGHRVRDCPKPKIDRFACKNCGQPGHKAQECTEPPNLDNVECRNCGEKGHFSRDCPQRTGGGACHNCGQEGHRAKECTEPKKIVCRNCDEEGHVSRECPKPRDYSRVKCANCGEMGHTKVRCKQPVPNEDADFDAGGGATDAVLSGGGDFGSTGDAGGSAAGNWGAPDAGGDAIGSWGGQDANATTGW